MEILPAIDLKNGKCVRLIQGDAAQETVYSENPLDVANQFASDGAKWLHMVDLDGAFTGSRVHTKIISEITDKTGLKVELGGGIRTIEDVDLYIKAGVSRVVLGTAAHNKPEFVKEAVEKYGPAIAVGIDARDGKVAVRGWTEITNTTVVDLAERCTNAGVATIIYTDIAVDGMLTGPDIKTLKLLLEEVPADIVASGGIANLNNIVELNSIKPKTPIGCIIGKAIYTKAISLSDAIRICTA